MIRFHVIIPARYQSTRLPGKPLRDIFGKSMIQRVYEQASQSGAVSVTVATDDQRIFDHVIGFGGNAVMTRADHESGTDRIFEASELLAIDNQELVINVQGDEPFIPSENILQVATLLQKEGAVMSTLCTPIIERAEYSNPNVVKVVLSDNGRAIYFSRASIPMDRDNQCDVSDIAFRHLGIYGFKMEYLRKFANMPVAKLESIEKLEQLRALANGDSIEIVVAEKIPPAGVDTPEDLQSAINYAMQIES